MILVPTSPSKSLLSPSALVILDPPDIERIEEAIKQVGAFGEIRLIAEDGHLGYIVTVTSEPLDKITLEQDQGPP